MRRTMIGMFEAFAVLLVCQPFFVNSDKLVAGHFGQRFILFAGPGTLETFDETKMAYRIFATPYDIRGALITVRCPLCRPGEFNLQEQFVSYGDSYGVGAPSTFRQNKTGKVGKSLLLHATLPVTVTLNINDKASHQDNFLALPEHVLDNKYVISGYGENGFLAVASIASGITKFSVRYKNRTKQEDTFTCKYDDNKEMTSGQSFSYTLQQYDVFLLICDGLTGSFVYADKPIAVFVGSYDIAVTLPDQRESASTYTKGHIQEQASPMNGCGMRFITPGLTTGFHPEAPFLHVVSCYSNIKVTYNRMETYLDNMGDVYETGPVQTPSLIECTVGCFVKLFWPSSSAGVTPAMVPLLSPYQYSSIYTFITIGNVAKFYLFMILKQSDIKDLCHNDYCGQHSDSTSWTMNNISHTETSWKLWEREVKPGFHTVYHMSIDVMFGMYVMRLQAGQEVISQAGMNLSTVLCHTTFMKMDDGLDNDCDDNADEELPNGKDDDGDGLVDEDVGTEPSKNLNGKWGDWSPWNCGINCGGRAMYRRFRLCNRPAPIGDGRPCRGPNGEESGRICDYSNVLCPEDCPPDRWGINCRKRCPNGCKHSKCNPVDGFCINCPAGKTGTTCAYDCPRHMFGANCSQSCKIHCSFSDCDPITGVCDIGLSLIPYFLICVGLSFIPAALICFFVYWCRSRDPKRVQIQKTIAKLDAQIQRVKMINQARRRTHNNTELRRRNTARSIDSGGSDSDPITPIEDVPLQEGLPQIRISTSSPPPFDASMIPEYTEV